MRVLSSEMELVASQFGKNNKSASTLMAEVRCWRRKLIISGRRWRRRVPHLTMLLLCLVRVIHGRRAAASKPKPRWCPECISQLDVPAQRPQPPGFEFDTFRSRHGQPGPRQSRGVWGVARCDGGVEPVDSGMMRVPTHLVITEKSRGPTRVLIIPHHACLRPVAAGRVRHHR